MEEIYMVSIDKAMTVFLEAQEMRLKQRTYRDYESVIELFQIYLNSYAYLRLPQEEREKYVSRFSRDEQYFTKTYGLDQFTTSIYSEFFEYFIVHKVASGEIFMKSAVRVIKKLTTWLFEEDYINSKKYRKLIEYFAEGKTKSLPKAEKV